MCWPSTRPCGAFEPLLADEDQEQDPDRWRSHAPGFPRGVADCLAMGLERGSWNWGICLSQRRCAQLSLLPSSKRLQPSKRLYKAMRSLQSPCAGSPIGSRGRTSLSNPTGRWPVRRARRCAQPSNKASPMAVCACSTVPASSIVAAAQSVGSVNGTGKQRRSRVGEVACCIRSGLAPRHCVFRDWSRREHRRACRQLLRHQRLEVSLPPPAAALPRKADVILSREPRAHSRLSWAERLARNARVPTAGQVTIRLFGVPEGFAISLGLATA
jgi:hypothetical protein